MDWYMNKIKSYADCMNELSADEVYEGLLRYGLFSEKLLPIFVNNSFFDAFKDFENFSKRPHKYICYESMRNTNTPRVLGIPCPMSYQKLCLCIKENWKIIQDFLMAQTKHQQYKVSRVHIRRIYGKKHIFQMNYDKWFVDGSPIPNLFIGNKYLVNADISNCFGSIYTHALPWALVGKDVAKGCRDNDKWYNKLDKKTQNCKHGETHGLLIGPHCSNLLSEIILTKIDCELKNWSYIRSIDDYRCFVSSYDDAQKFLSELAAELRKFGLSLNQKKTKISSLPSALTEEWVRQMNTFLINSSDIVNYKIVEVYLDNAIELMNKTGGDTAILNYSLKVLSSAKEKMSRNAVDLCIKTFLHLTVLYPYLIPLLDDFLFSRFEVSKVEIEIFSKIMIKDTITNANYEAFSFCLFFAVKYDFQLDFDVDYITSAKDCILLTMAFLYYKDKADKNKLDVLRDVALKIQDDGDFEEYWLFVYEILKGGEIKTEYSDWKNLKNNKISFIKTIDKITSQSANNSTQNTD